MILLLTWAAISVAFYTLLSLELKPETGKQQLILITASSLMFFISIFVIPEILGKLLFEGRVREISVLKLTYKLYHKWK